MYPLGNPTATGGLLLVLHCPSAMYVYHRLCRLLLPRSRTPPAGAGWAIKPSKVATEVLARHAHDHNRRHLLVTVLEARGLTPRRGVVVALRWEGGGGGRGGGEMGDGARYGAAAAPRSRRVVLPVPADAPPAPHPNYQIPAVPASCPAPPCPWSCRATRPTAPP